MILLLALACAPEEDPDALRDGDTADTGGAGDTGDTDTDDTDTGDTDTGDTDTGDTDTGGPDTDVDAFLVTFEGTVVTVAGTPFGFTDDVRTTPISGSLSWNRSLPDQELDNDDRGLYDHRSSGTFELSVGGRVIRGSGSPQVEVENFSSDTFRYVDGASIFGEHERHMTVDDVEDPSIGLWIAVTDGDGAVFSSDDNPTAWPFPDIASYPHTFSVEDTGGTLLLQLSAAGPG